MKSDGVKNKRGVDLISDVLPFGGLWYAGPNAVSNAIGYGNHRSRSHDAVIRVYDDGILRIVLPEMITGTDSRTSAGSACTIPCPADSHCSTQLG